MFRALVKKYGVVPGGHARVRQLPQRPDRYLTATRGAAKRLRETLHAVDDLRR